MYLLPFSILCMSPYVKRKLKKEAILHVDITKMIKGCCGCMPIMSNCAANKLELGMFHS